VPPFNMQLSEHAERLARQLKQQPDYRILYRLPRPDEVWCRSSPVPELLSTTRIAVVDCETDGLDPESNKIIELAVVKLTIDDIAGDLTDISPPVSWLEDPKRPLTPEIENLTGLTDADLAGKSFDEEVIAACFDDVDVIVAHNARFDRAFFKRRFPGLDHAWACSLAEVDWLAHGFDSGRSVTSLLTASGHFPDQAYRAGPDAWAVAALLVMPGYDGRTIGAHLIERARKPTYRLHAEQAPFAVKDSLKAAGYRWCDQRKSWWLDADSELLDNERAWLIALCPAILPRVERIDYFSRHAS
jgi:DNA polymerase III subunit epsilon